MRETGFVWAAEVPALPASVGDYRLCRLTSDGELYEDRPTTGWTRLRTSAASLTGLPTPQRLGFSSWSCDPVFCTSNKSLTNQDVMFMLTFPSLAVPSGGTVNVEHSLGAAGVTFTYARVGVYAYNAGTGIATLIGTSADLSTTWNSTGNKSVPVTISQGINPGDAIYIAFSSNATTAPSLTASPGVSSLGRGTPVRHARLPGQSALPSTWTPAGSISLSVMPYVGY